MELVDDRMRESEKDESTGATEFDRIGPLIRDCTDGKARAALRDQLAELIVKVDTLSTKEENLGTSAAGILDEADGGLLAFINNELNN